MTYVYWSLGAKKGQGIESGLEGEMGFVNLFASNGVAELWTKVAAHNSASIIPIISKFFLKKQQNLKAEITFRVCFHVCNTSEKISQQIYIHIKMYTYVHK